MPFTLATWNINSVRLREGLVVRLLAEESPDILCLQECKSPVESSRPSSSRRWATATWWRGGKRATTAWRSCRNCRSWMRATRILPQLGHARHVAARLENGVTIHNCYVPAGGDIPDRDQNEKFGQKLDFLTEMRDYFRWESPTARSWWAI
jgi:exodeoxyribonuclease III